MKSLTDNDDFEPNLLSFSIKLAPNDIEMIQQFPGSNAEVISTRCNRMFRRLSLWSDSLTG
jgi:hypothetical protein